MKPEQLPNLVLAAAVLLVLVFAESWTVTDPDLWGHVRFGQDILTTGSIPRHDSYSFTSDREWINHEWLSEVIIGGAYRLAGGVGLIALKILLIVSAFVILWRTLRRAGVRQPLALLLLLVANVGAYGLMLTVRPQLFSMLLCAILFAMLDRAGQKGPRVFLWLPLLFAAWANMHGGWLVGFGVVAAWCAGAVLSRTISWAWAVCGPLLALAGSLVNPYGPGLWRFLHETVGLGREDIAEWQPLLQAQFLILPWLVSAALVLWAWRRGGRRQLPALLVTTMLGVLSLRVSRIHGFFALASVMLLARSFGTVGPECLPLSRRPSRRETAIVASMCLVGVLAVGVAVRGRITCVATTGAEVIDSWAPEAEAIQFLRMNRLRGRLIAWFDYGEMAIWHTSPGLRVSYDGRRETVYSEAVRSAHQRFYRSASDTSYADTIGADYAWLRLNLPVVVPLLRHGWVQIFRGSKSVILARAPGGYTQPAPWTGPRCFPGP